MLGHITYYFNPTESARDWGFQVTSAGHTKSEPHQLYPKNAHPSPNDFTWERGRCMEEFALVYIVDGGGIFEDQRLTNVPVETGHAIMLFPGKWHRYRPHPETGWEEYWVTFGGSIVENWLEKGFLSVDRPVAATQLGLSLAPLFEELLRLMDRRTSQVNMVASGFCHLILGRVLSAATTSRATSEKAVIEAADYLRLHADKPVDLPALAARLGMSYSGFRRAFVQYLETPPHRFHQQARLAMVKELLGNTDLPLKIIAERLHYPSEFYLMQTFKRQTGQTPTQWRNRLGQRS